jgi:iron complex outermembrane receptor protein
MSLKFTLPLAGMLLLGMYVPSYSQEKEPADEDLYEMSLEDLMNVPINSASKKNETLFDAPLSSYTITRADIDKAGSTSIMEALRLAPGVIVREQTNGIYDIHIRGFDNVLRHNAEYQKSNLATLVMIDNRPVFNNNLGGTSWEALPVDINDVDRIEVVRGPSSPLFGPNAVTGVINIITKRANKDAETYANANVQAGTPSTLIANLSLGQKVSNKFNYTVSTNYQNRKRFDDLYYQNNTETFVPIETITSNFEKQYPHPDRAMNKWGANAFLNYKTSEKVSFDLSLGLQESNVQKNFIGGGNTPFTVNTSQSRYANLAAQIYGLHVRTSVIKGTDDLDYGSSPGKYDYVTTNAEAEYEIKVGNVATIVPGFNYQNANYNDKDYFNAQTGAYLNGETVKINTTSGYLRTDIKPVKDLRVIAAVRVDKFSVPNDAYLAYEFAATYNLNENNLIRAAITRSNSGSFIGNNYLNIQIPVAPGVYASRVGNQDLNLFRISMIEFGYRSQLSKTLQLDIDVFQQKAENFSAIITTSQITSAFANVPTVAKQTGTTLSINIVPNAKWQIKPFLTYQKTTTEDLPANYGANGTYSDSDHKSTPAVYGGYFVNFRPNNKFNFNLNGYCFSSQRQYSADSPSDNSAVGNISGKVLVNAKVAYNITQKFNVFLNGRNIFHSNAREYYGTDRIGSVYALGAAFHLN